MAEPLINYPEIYFYVGEPKPSLSCAKKNKLEIVDEWKIDISNMPISPVICFGTTTMGVRILSCIRVHRSVVRALDFKEYSKKNP